RFPRQEGYWQYGEGVRGAELLALLRSPHLTGLRILDLRDNMADAELQQALATPAVGGLEELHLGNTPTDDVVFGHLTPATVPGLRYLDLEATGVTLNALADWLDGPLGRQLRGLRFGEDAVYNTAPDFRPAFEAGQLESLRLHGGLYGVASAGVIVGGLLSARPTGHLRVLDLSGVSLTGAPTRQLAAAPVTAGLADLRLANCQLDSADLGALLQSPHLGALRRLDLSQNTGLREPALLRLVRHPDLQRLVGLGLEGVPVSLAVVRELVRAPVATQLRELSLALTDDFDDCLRELAAARMPALNSLVLGIDGAWEDEAVRLLGRSPGMPHLTTLINPTYNPFPPAPEKLAGTGIVRTAHSRSFQYQRHLDQYGHLIV